ncbi:MAG: hypothetical protein OXF11_16345 [Deltaproteobacteria bacterium]|nr:hypothetical protein [Deltaproteobacteria bacterium]
MEKLKEYAGVIIAVMTVAASLSGLLLWTIQIQIVPEIRRLDERIELVHADVTGGLDRMDGRFDRMDGRFDRMDNRLERMDDRINARFDRLEGRFNARFEQIDARFDRLEGRFSARLTRVEGDIKTILLRLPAPEEPAAAQSPTSTAR